MNPIRRNTMEDVHVVNGPGSWGAPNDATFLGKYIKYLFVNYIVVVRCGILCVYYYILLVYSLFTLLRRV